MQSDTDADNVSDAEEVRGGTNPLAADTDGDGLGDGQELGFGTNPLVSDTDADGLNDLQERNAGTNPLSPDSDSDGLLDGAELVRGTDPLRADTDGDGLADGAEVVAGLNPLVRDSFAVVGHVYCNGAVTLLVNGVPGIWYTDTGRTFGGWLPGDLISVQFNLGDTNVAVLHNLNNSTATAAINYGQVVVSGVVSGPLEYRWNGWSTEWYLPVDGTLYRLNNALGTVMNWNIGDSALICHAVWQTESGPLDMWHAIDATACEDALLAQ